MRLLISLFLFLAGCAKEKTPQNNPTKEALPAACAFTQTATHQFLNWPSDLADEYDCPLYSNLTCTFYQSATESELVCGRTNPVIPQGVPSGCTVAGGGSHGYLDGAVGTVTTYRCGTFQGNQCWFFDGASEELLCYRQIGEN